MSISICLLYQYFPFEGKQTNKQPPKTKQTKNPTSDILGVIMALYEKTIHLAPWKDGNQ